MSVSVVAFIHTYARDGELGSYMEELVKGFESCGVNLHLIITNHLVPNLGSTRYKASISEDKVIQYINDVNPSFLFTTNRGGITKRIMQETSCPIITWMVDRIPFLHHGGGHESLFCERDHVITSSYKNVARLEKIYPILKGRVYYKPFATNIESFTSIHSDVQDINISFVGTYFYAGQFTKILEYYQDCPEVYYGLLRISEKIEDNYDLDIEEAVRECGVQRVLEDFSLDIFKFKGLIANVVSLNKRVHCLEAVSDLGLQLYGTPNWVKVNQFSLPLLRCFKAFEFIKTREQLVSLYQRSKIAINISHHQADAGLPYRIFDIMASNALLITEYHEDSDLFRLFGKDMPVPMYSSAQELRDLCSYYLNNENERKALVKRCNDLVSRGFSFKDRVRDFVDIVGERTPEIFTPRIQVDARKLFQRSEPIVVSSTFLFRIYCAMLRNLWLPLPEPARKRISYHLPVSLKQWLRKWIR
ncbi:glycosyltransferase family 1 protein [Candidatus Parcubacteria bacterium]|nr:MAG: glycosyltransferase family 1 protein [Candidatus Parcubacteria bacterium]